MARYNKTVDAKRNFMRAVDLIEKKKQGKEHSKEEIYFLVDGYLNGEVEDYQMSAWLMAVCFCGLSVKETAYLTQSYVDSGDILDFSKISNCVVDKHSTGGVGDKVTLVLIPLLASCGLTCAKLSGRGLGYTGGTIDKLEAIKNFKCEMTNEKFIAQIKKIGCAISSQSPNLTPADGKIYALRDVSATVDNKSLICASVVSKKIASGADVIVLDVKYGLGAFIKTKEEAVELAQLMINIGSELGRKISAVITSMEQPLGSHVGNTLEVIESIDFLKGEMQPDLKDVCFEIGAVSLIKGGVCNNRKDAIKLMEEKINNGMALKKFKEIIKEQGGNEKILEDYSLLENAQNTVEIKAETSGTVVALNALEIAKACKILGAGRDKKSDNIDFAVGIILNKKIGDTVLPNETLATIHYNSNKRLNESIELTKNAYSVQNKEVVLENLIYKIIN